MTIPFTGALVLLLGAWLFLFSPKYLYAAMVISIPFSATAVLNLRQASEGKSVMAWLFLSSLWVIREIASGTPPWHKKGWFATRRARYGLLAFGGAVLASLTVPLISSGTSWIPDVPASQIATVSVPIQFSFYNVTQTLYMSAGILLAIFIAAENWTSVHLLHTLKLYVGSCTFVAVWGLLQLTCNLMGYPYPAFVFNNSTNASALGYKEVVGLHTGLTRISSAALEPSVLAGELIIPFALLLVFRSFRKPILSRSWDRVAFVLVTITLIVSTSTTAYAGMLIAMVAVAFSLLRAGRPSRLYFISIGLAVAAGLLFSVAVPVVGKIAYEFIGNKLNTGSGMARLSSTVVAARDFLSNPILGLGWHTVDSSDWVFLILANTGLVGLLAFLSFVYPILRGLWKAAGQGYLAAVVFSAVLGSLLLTAEIAGFEYATGYIWMFLGLGAGAFAAIGTGVQQRGESKQGGARRSLVPPPSAESTS